MKAIVSPKQEKLHMILIMALTISPLALMALLLGINFSTINLLGLILLIELIVWTGYFNPVLYGFISLVSTGIFYGLYAWRHPLYTVIKEAWWDFYINFGNYRAGYDLLTANNRLIAFVVIGVISIILTRLFLTKAKLHFLYFVTTLSYLVYGWYLHVDQAYGYIVLHCVLYLLFYTTDAYLTQSTLHTTIAFRGNESLFGKWIKTSSRYLMLILIGAMILPAANPLIVWEEVENSLIDQFPALKDLRQDIEQNRAFSRAELFNLAQTGFSDESGYLGGPVALNDGIALEVISPYPLYLRGNILTHYDGRQWDHGNRLTVEKETDKQLLREVRSGQVIDIKVTNKNLSSFTLFTPYQVDSISIDRPGKLWIDINQQITLLGARYPEESYRMTAILPEESAQATQGSAAILFNREDYLQLPEMLPDRVKTFAKTHSETGQTPYEQAQLLTSYLRNNYTYSLSPEYLPAGEDFVDHFLFEQQEGYCTYFATSLSILLRTLDIPTRYIEGFRTPDQAINGRYQVALANGHAWVEAYFDGYGWVTLEGTPAYQMPTAPLDTQLLIAEEALDLYSLEDEKAYIKAMGELSPEEAFNADTEAGNTSAGDWIIKKAKAIVPSFLMVLLLTLPLIRFFSLENQYRRYNNQPASKEKLIYLYHNITELLGHSGWPRLQGETTSEYAHRVKKQFYDATHDFEQITQDYLLCKYGHPQDIKKETENIAQYFAFVEQRLKHKLGRFTYYRLKYVHGNLYTRHPASSYLTKDK